MALKSKKISLTLMDGELSGRIKCEIAGWIGIIYKSPRSALNRFKDKDLTYLQQAGVYILFGTNDKHDQAVYIGQAGKRKYRKGLLARIQEQHPSIDWMEAIMFTTKDDSFRTDDINYLENYLCNLAQKAGRYCVTNGYDPNPGILPEESEIELDEYIEYINILMNILGNKVFESVNLQTMASNKNEPLLYMEYKNGKATGKRTSDGFVIYKGSTINPDTTKSCPEKVIKLRERFSDKISDTFELLSDIHMTSATAAAGFVGGAHLNGKAMWHDFNGQSLKQIED